MNDLAVPSANPWPSRIFQIFSGTYLFLIGLSLALVLLATGGPSFWYLPAAFLFALSGIAWFRPRLGASFSLLFTLIFFVLLVSLKPWSWPEARAKGFAILLVLLLAVAVCLIQISRRGLTLSAVATAAICILLCVAVDRIFTNRPHIRTLTMDWTADGSTPWTDPIPKGPNGDIPVLIFTVVPNGYCYDAVFSDELRKHLLSLKKNSIRVDYNEFTTFGKPTGTYNIHAVEGLVLNNGRRAVIPTKNSYGGTMMIPTAGMPKTYEPLTCPR
ncbi:hypothetical protein FTO74_07150 [Granulicella sp. WH15]|uniref:hypothetical protein n=1 Tax=Granulicella sp. WH15 TaxID=2602070 RepID=UPI001366A762|nr:hypothetical protein [Granulicella sp. WH15]QHN03170.1 hypothetical protein FTO74_07150 [Granulicella sp. WH15]